MFFGGRESTKTPRYQYQDQLVFLQQYQKPLMTSGMLRCNKYFAWYSMVWVYIWYQNFTKGKILIYVISPIYFTGWCFFLHELYVSIYWECHHPNWLIFFRGVETTNQLWCSNRHGVKQQEWRNKQLHDTVQWHWGSHRVWQLSLRIWCSYRRFWPWSIVPAKVY